MAASGTINWTNFANVVGATVIVGSEAVGAGGATGWALASLMKLGDQAVLIATLVGIAGGLAVAVAFMRMAYRAEPFR